MTYPIAEHYERTVHAFDLARRKTFNEQAWLDRFRQPLKRGARVLDLGCGAGEPLARYLMDYGCSITGVDVAEGMIALARTRFPRHQWIRSDMRRANPEGRFAGVIAWDSFYHLHQSDQANMLERIAEWLEPAGVLLFNTEPAAGAHVHKDHYHPSLGPDGYRMLFRALGLMEIAFGPRDPRAIGRSVWLARKMK